MTLTNLSRLDHDITVICIPFSGGAATSFLPIVRHVGDSAQILSVDPPGHGGNDAEPIRKFDQLLDFYDEAIDGAVARSRSVLFGHSLGGLIAYALCERWEQQRRGPSAVVISGTAAPGAKVRRDPGWSGTDAELINMVIRFGALDRELLSDQTFTARLLKTLRADADVVRSYRDGDRSVRKLATPAYLWAGNNDAQSPPWSVYRWVPRFLSSSFALFDGPHMFPISRASCAAEMLLDIASRTAGRSRSDLPLKSLPFTH